MLTPEAIEDAFQRWFYTPSERQLRKALKKFDKAFADTTPDPDARRLIIELLGALLRCASTLRGVATPDELRLYLGLCIDTAQKVTSELGQALTNVMQVDESQ